MLSVRTPVCMIFGVILRLDKQWLIIVVVIETLMMFVMANGGTDGCEL